MIDLRSDTVTKPCDRMRQCMAQAPVGDDVYEEDPTVAELEALVAEMLGKERGLFVPSGTMGNLLAAMVHGRDRRSEIICGSDAHVARDEVGGISAVAGVHTFQIPNLPDGGLALDALRTAVLADDDIHYSIPRAVFVENTHGNSGGKVLTLGHVDDIRGICALRQQNPVALHCDGARLWNAAAALGVAPAVVARPFDTVTCCLSKGLGAPMGSVLVGPAAFIREARWARKMLGGGMRQVGIMAAAGVFALRHNVNRLSQDHEHLSWMRTTVCDALGTTASSNAAVTLDVPQTNILFVRTNDAAKRDAVVQACKEQQVLVGAWPGNAIRIVMHLNVTKEGVERATRVVGEALQKCFAR